MTGASLPSGTPACNQLIFTSETMPKVCGLSKGHAPPCIPAVPPPCFRCEGPLTALIVNGRGDEDGWWCDNAACPSRNHVQHPASPPSPTTPPDCQTCKRRLAACRGGAFCTNRDCPHVNELVATPTTPAPECEKAPHYNGARHYFHASDDDGPYEINGKVFCGRCHQLEHSVTTPAPVESHKWLILGFGPKSDWPATPAPRCKCGDPTCQLWRDDIVCPRCSAALEADMDDPDFEGKSGDMGEGHDADCPHGPLPTIDLPFTPVDVLAAAGSRPAAPERDWWKGGASKAEVKATGQRLLDFVSLHADRTPQMMPLLHDVRVLLANAAALGSPSAWSDIHAPALVAVSREFLPALHEWSGVMQMRVVGERDGELSMEFRKLSSQGESTEMDPGDLRDLLDARAEIVRAAAAKDPNWIIAAHERFAALVEDDTLVDVLGVLAALASSPTADRYSSEVRAVLCRVFDDVDEVYAEWEAWYQPASWLGEFRALGAFIRERLDKPAGAPLRGARIDELLRDLAGYYEQLSTTHPDNDFLVEAEKANIALTEGLIRRLASEPVKEYETLKAAVLTYIDAWSAKDGLDCAESEPPLHVMQNAARAKARALHALGVLASAFRPVTS